MKKLLLVLIILLTGCGNSINSMVSTGKKPPLFFKMTDKRTMDNFVFDTQKFSFMFPTSRVSDFTQRGGWSGMTYRDGHGIAFEFKDGAGYHITVDTDYEPSKENAKIAKALENGTYKFRKQSSMKHQGSYTVGFINSHLEYHGKEHYPCLVSSQIVTYDKWGSKYKTGYSCYKLNSSKTKAKDVTISLIYNKPTNPTLAKQYTYADLKRRAKRMLDSLYIKDGW